jgi:type 1 glutamine amidotransferase
MHILATAYSAKEHKGTGMHEPMAWTVPFGKGRVFVTVLGHAVPETAAPDTAILLERGTEWAATGAVTIPALADLK